ncbi:hypothetical protein G9U51_08405 [Calidifontibacter sp. DB0510]|uniref:Uncharacterized protein n=1 Tax=Metallococcus carri TaxID=1656884 RepID=A0A967B545_9MICO|nr:hypothetical protein [Metallococcus carri]NHN55797.1 hypothetical protein [Metallococcus carri]NOP38514.1 hypothetical protein [Calidifontibacter sp. DB2511S]
MSTVVDIRDLHQALTAVLPHASSVDVSDLARVRLVVDRVNMAVLATDAHSSGLAIVSVVGGSDDSGLAIDLSVESVKKLLAVHRPVKVTGKDVEPDQQLELAVASTREGQVLSTRDISGLLSIGEELVLPTLGTSTLFPDIEGYLGEAVHGHFQVPPEYDGQPLIASFAVFDAAVRAYKRPMAVRLLGQGRHRFLVTVGDSFIGAVSVRHPLGSSFDDDQEVLDAWGAWLERLPSTMRRTDDDEDAAEPDAGAADGDVTSDASPADPTSTRHLSPVP